MDWKAIDTTYCGVAAAADLIGDRWSILIMRDVFFGVRRYHEIQADIDVSTAVLADRLKKLCDHGLLTKVPYQADGKRKRDEYHLTERGFGFMRATLALAEFGYDHVVPEGKRLLELYDIETGQEVRVGLVREDGSEVTHSALGMRVNPASQP